MNVEGTDMYRRVKAGAPPGRRQKGHTEIYRGAEYAERFLPKIKAGYSGKLPNRLASSENCTGFQGVASSK